MSYSSAMRIFCTNDDGIDAPGLPVLALALAASGHSVVIGAPDREMSGTGTSVKAPAIAEDGGIVVTRRILIEAPEIEAYSVAATPALTVLLAEQGVFGDPPDIVVSGPNIGANVGHDVHHSGTVGAALTAQKHGLHGVAISLAMGFGFTEARPERPVARNWSTTACLGTALVDALSDAGLTTAVCVNLNVPDVPMDELAGVRTVALADGSPFRITGFVEKPVPAEVAEADDADANGTRLIVPRFAERSVVHASDTDAGALHDGVATITWLVLTSETEPHIEEMHAILGDLPMPSH